MERLSDLNRAMLLFKRDKIRDTVVLAVFALLAFSPVLLLILSSDGLHGLWEYIGTMGLVFVFVVFFNNILDDKIKPLSEKIDSIESKIDRLTGSP